MAAKFKLLSRPRPLLHTCLLALLACHANAGWVLVGEGDCIGPQLQGSAGKEPDPERCTPAMAGKTSLCFPQACYPGCQVIDIATTKCLMGADTALIYTCVPDKPASNLPSR